MPTTPTADRPSAAMPPPPPPPPAGTAAPRPTAAPASSAAPAPTAAPAPSAAPASSAALTPSAATPTATVATEDGGPDAGAARRALLLRGALWGPVAIGLPTLLLMLAAAQAGDGAGRPLRLLTTMVLGGAGLTSGSALLGLVLNVVLGVVLGVAFAALAPLAHGRARALLTGGLVFGAVVFVVDGLLLGPLLPGVLELRDDALLLAARLLTGVLLALALLPDREPT